MQSLQFAYLVISLVVDDNNKHIGYLVVGGDGRTRMLSLSQIETANTQAVYYNAVYDMTTKKLLGINGVDLDRYPRITVNYIALDRECISVLCNILDNQTNKPVGVVAYNSIGGRFNLTYKRLNELTRKFRPLNFKMELSSDGLKVVDLLGSDFGYITMSVPSSPNKSASTSATCVDTSNPGSIPIIKAYNMQELKDSEYNQSCQDKLVRTMLNMQRLTPYYYTILAAIKRVPAPIETMGVTEDTLLYDMQFVANLGIPELTFILIHEILHLTMQHSIRFGRRTNHELWNIATDLYINSIICNDFGCKFGGGVVNVGTQSAPVQIKAPDFGVFIETIGQQIDLAVDTPESIYDRLMQENQNKQSPSQGQGQGQQGQQGQQSQQGQGQQGQGQQGQGQQGQGQQGQGQGQGQGQQGNAQQQAQQGSSNVSQGAKQVQQGANQAQNSLNSSQQSQQAQQQIRQGIQQVQQGMQTAQQGMQNGNQQQVQQGTQQAQGGMSSVNNGIQQMNQALNGQCPQASQQMSNGAQQMQQGIDQIGNASQQTDNGSQGQFGENDLNNGNNQISQDDFNSNNDNSTSSGMREVSVTYNGKQLRGTIMVDVMSNKEAKSKDDLQSNIDASKRALQKIDTKIKMEKEELGDLVKNAGAGGALTQRYIEVGLSSGVDWRVLFKNICTDKPKKTFTLASPNQDYMNMGMTIADRRAIGKPTSISHVKFAIDVSGSVTKDELQHYLSEINNIYRHYKMDGELIYWSTDIGDAGMFSNLKDMLKVSPKSTGGTDCKCVFEYLARKVKVHGKLETDKPRDIKAIFILTDGVFSMNFDEYKKMFGKKVVWLITGKKGNPITFNPPFGRTIGLNID